MTTATTGITVFKHEDLLSFISGQLAIFSKLGFPSAAGKSEAEFHNLCLASVKRRIPEMLEVENHQMPVLLVLPHGFLAREKQMELLGIESDYTNPVRDVTEVEAVPSGRPYLTYKAEYGPPISVSPSRFATISRETQPLTFDQGLAMLAQAEKLRNFCEGLYFAGSSWFLYGHEQTPCFSSLKEEGEKITGRYRFGGDCASYASCAKSSTIFNAGSGEGHAAENLGRHKTL